MSSRVMICHTKPAIDTQAYAPWCRAKARMGLLPAVTWLGKTRQDASSPQFNPPGCSEKARMGLPSSCSRRASSFANRMLACRGAQQQGGRAQDTGLTQGSPRCIPSEGIHIRTHQPPILHKLAGCQLLMCNAVSN